MADKSQRRRRRPPPKESFASASSFPPYSSFCVQVTSTLTPVTAAPLKAARYVADDANRDQKPHRPHRNAYLCLGLMLICVKTKMQMQDERGEFIVYFLVLNNAGAGT